MELGMVMDLCNCSNIVRDTHNITILFLVPYILQLNVLTGLHELLKGSWIALGFWMDCRETGLLTRDIL